MSFHDETPEPRPTALLRRCRRCGALLAEAHADPSVALRRAIEAPGGMFQIHGCADGAEGLAELVGTGPGRPREPLTVAGSAAP